MNQHFLVEVVEKLVILGLSCEIKEEEEGPGSLLHCLDDLTFGCSQAPPLPNNIKLKSKF